MKTLYYNSKIYIEKGRFAEAVLVEENKIIKTGTNKELMDIIDENCSLVDCMGKTMVPGFNDTHLHLLFLALQMDEPQIKSAKSIDELIDICKQYKDNNPEKVKRGMHAQGWDQNAFCNGEKRFPTRYDLDKISEEFPIVLERVCGHALVVNTCALKKLGLLDTTNNIQGGEISIGENNEPDGIFYENACKVARSLIPEMDKQFRQEALINIMNEAASLGITSVQSNDMGHPWGGSHKECLELFKGIYDDGLAPIRYCHQMSFSSPSEFEIFLDSKDYRSGKYEHGDMLTIGPLKLFKDGSLGARTALMKIGYLNDPSNLGVDCTPMELMTEYCKIAQKHNVQVVTHAIGNRAIEETISCYEEAFVDNENKLRHSIIHCQITDEDVLNLIAEKNILVQAQPVFILSDLDILDNFCCKELAETSYNFGTLARRGVHLSYGTDSPVESFNPFINIYAAVTKNPGLKTNKESFFHRESVDVETAIDAYTYESAYNEFKEDMIGRIKEGYLADMVLLDKDIFTCSEETIKTITPLLTIVDGRVVYQK